MSIQIQQASVKLLLEPGSSVNLDDFIPIFHAWIRENRIEDQLLIDVADYRHVPSGPGVMLIANEAHYNLDATGGEAGLRYLSRRGAHRDAAEALREALKRAATAAALVQAEESLGGSLKFRTDNLQMRVVNRLTAPNTDQTRALLEPVWTDILSSVGFEGLELEGESDLRSPFGLRLRSCSASPDLAALRAAL